MEPKEPGAPEDGLTIDDATWPIVMVEFKHQVTKASLAFYIDRMEGLIRRGRFTRVVIVYHAWPPVQRQTISEWYAQNAHTGRLAGVAFVPRTDEARNGLAITLGWSGEGPYGPYCVVDSVSEAVEWCEAILRARPE